MVDLAPDPVAVSVRSRTLRTATVALVALIPFVVVLKRKEKKKEFVVICPPQKYYRRSFVLEDFFETELDQSCRVVFFW